MDLRLYSGLFIVNITLPLLSNWTGKVGPSMSASDEIGLKLTEHLSSMSVLASDHSSKSSSLGLSGSAEAPPGLAQGSLTSARDSLGPVNITGLLAGAKPSISRQTMAFLSLSISSFLLKITLAFLLNLPPFLGFSFSPLGDVDPASTTIPLSDGGGTFTLDTPCDFFKLPSFLEAGVSHTSQHSLVHSGRGRGMGRGAKGGVKTLLVG